MVVFGVGFTKSQRLACDTSMTNAHLWGAIVMSRKNRLLDSNESDSFQASELFFSRTDPRGVIRFTNETFRRISGYDWEALRGAPHKIVRHPNMPRGLFHLLWEFLGKKLPVGGYVKNLSKDGTHYWVFAVMVPTDDGYLSVRLKPLGGKLNDIKRLYLQLRKRELEEDITPEQSKVDLISALNDLGYNSYQHFMIRALSEEIAARSAALNIQPDSTLPSLLNMLDAVAEIEEHSQVVARIFEETKQIPHNMKLQAQRLEGREGPIGVISGNHQEMMRSLEEAVTNFSKAAHEGADHIGQVCIITSTTRLLSEVHANFNDESVPDDIDKAAELSRLVGLQRYSSDMLDTGLNDLTARTKRFYEMCRDIRRVMSGLEMTRIMCKIERSNLTVDADGLDESIVELNRCETELSAVILKIEANVAFIQQAPIQKIRKLAA